ncbi:MAG: HEAT repeat domain-containing protein [Planctomycetes bacterium]|nr:HEAT repeat domain-containing protein [Planctomycetota bacterium]
MNAVHPAYRMLVAAIAVSLMLYGSIRQGVADEASPASASVKLETLLRDARNESSKVRAEAINKLAAEGSERARQAVVAALEDDNDAVRFMAAYNLSKLGAAAIPSLQKLMSGANSEVRGRVVLVFSNMTDPARMEPLIAAMTDDDDQVARSAYKGLTQNESVPALKPLKPLIAVLEKGNVFARSSAAVLLPDCQDEGAVEPLIAVLQKDVPEVRPYAANAFTRIKNPKAVEPLLAALDDTNPLLRSQAALALGTQADPRAVDPLLARLKDEDADVRKSAVLALGKIRERRTFPSLIPFLKDERAETRVEAIWSVAALGGPEAFDALMPMLTTSMGDERQEIAAAIGLCGDSRALPLLVALLDDKEIGMVGRATEGLGNLKDQQGVLPLLTAHLWKRVPETEGVLAGVIRTSLQQILGESMDPLIAAAKNPDPQIRARAVWALNSLDGDRQIDRIVEAATDPDPSVRLEAAGILAYKTGTKDFEAITSLLKDSETGVRRQAAWALGERAEAQRVELLIAALQDSESAVRSAAADALGRTGDERAIPKLQALLNDSDGDVVYSATQSLQALESKQAQASKSNSKAGSAPAVTPPSDANSTTTDHTVDNSAHDEHPAPVAKVEESSKRLADEILMQDDGLPTWVVFIAVGFVLGGLFAIWYAWRTHTLAAASQSWPQATARILSCSIRSMESSDDTSQSITRYVPVVEYEFEVAGETIRGNRIKFGGTPQSTSLDKAKQLAGQYAEGSSVTVYYDPEKPSQCTLDRHVSLLGIIILVMFGVIFVIVGLVLSLLVFAK